LLGRAARDVQLGNLCWFAQLGMSFSCWLEQLEIRINFLVAGVMGIIAGMSS